MQNIKTLILGAVVALAGVCLGEAVAHAECDYGRQAAIADAAEGEARGYTCEVIEMRDGTFEAQCDEEAFPAESAACNTFVESFDGLDVGTDAASTYSTMYEACMTIALHTPGAVH